MVVDTANKIDAERIFEISKITVHKTNFKITHLMEFYVDYFILVIGKTEKNLHRFKIPYIKIRSILFTKKTKKLEVSFLFS